MRSLAWLLAIGVVGCGDNLTLTTTTRTQVIPSIQGDRAAFVLEPLLVDGSVFTEKAPAVLVDLDTDEEIDTFVVGMTHVVLGTSQAWVLQSSFAEWHGDASSEPATQAASMAIVDRNTLQVTSHAVLDPPIDTPIVITTPTGDDELFDVSHEPIGADHNVIIRLRASDGTAQKLAEDEARDETANPVWCSSPGHLVYAFAGKYGNARILDIRRNPLKWYWASVDLPMTDLKPGGIACDQIGARVALDVDEAVHGKSVLVVDLATGDRIFHAGLGPPFAIQGDGSSVIARDVGTGQLVRVTDKDAMPLPLFTDAGTNNRPSVVGNQALFTTRTEFRIIDLKTAQISPAIDVSFDGVRVIPWPAANGFAVMHYRGDELTGLGIGSSSGSTMMTLPPLVRDPELVSAAGTRMYIVTSNDKRDQRQLFGFDHTMAEPVSATTPPECDPGAITRGSCR